MTFPDEDGEIVGYYPIYLLIKLIKILYNYFKPARRSYIIGCSLFGALFLLWVFGVKDFRSNLLISCSFIGWMAWTFKLNRSGNGLKINQCVKKRE